MRLAYLAEHEKKKIKEKDKPASKFPWATQDAGRDRKTSQKQATQDLTQKHKKTEKNKSRRSFSVVGATYPESCVAHRASVARR